MKRTIIKIDESLCNGCGACVRGCHEGALQLINGKAVIVSELYCDGLGACIGDCPVGAIQLEEREAEPYDEEAVMERLVPKGQEVILAHLHHLREHGEKDLLLQGNAYLKKHNIILQPATLNEKSSPVIPTGCPGSMSREIKRKSIPVGGGFRPAVASLHASELRQFPVQLQLLNPNAGFLKDSHLLLAADCTAFACGDFHSRFLKGKTLAIACSKLDSKLENYLEKIKMMIRDGAIQSLTVLIMEVPCCRGLAQLAEIARENSGRHIPVQIVVLSVEGEVKSEQWI